MTTRRSFLTGLALSPLTTLAARRTQDFTSPIPTPTIITRDMLRGEPTYWLGMKSHLPIAADCYSIVTAQTSAGYRIKPRDILVPESIANRFYIEYLKFDGRDAIIHPMPASRCIPGDAQDRLLRLMNRMRGRWGQPTRLIAVLVRNCSSSATTFRAAIPGFATRES